jgi:ADP-ribose pyrophosphatase YjhB (NUDIX family)
LDRLNATILTLRHQINKSSVWIEVHISQSSLVPQMAQLGFRYHHAQDDICVLNLWLQPTDSLVPEFATHHIGVGGIVINSRQEILCVRERRPKSYSMPWKIPGGLSNLGEHIDEAVVREILEETGIQTEFRNVLCFRHAHGLANGRSDIYFVCRLDPVEGVDQDGNCVIPEPTAQESEIEAASWVPYTEFRDMVKGENGHPMISHVLDLLDRGQVIARKDIRSIVPGRKPNPIYSPFSLEEETKYGTQM